MTSIGSPSPFFLAGKKAYEVERSLRFNRADNAVLTRSPSSTTNSTKQTLSFWFKISSLLTSNNQGIMFAGGSDGSWAYAQFFQGTFYFGNSAGPYWMGNLTLRDFCAWYHAVIVIDTTLSTSNDRQKLYINGVQQERNSGSSDPSQNSNYEFLTNSSWTYYIGKRATNDFNFDGYMAEINFVQGLALDASYFGETDAITGQWNPKKYVGSYGTNGFYLNFSDNSGTTATTLGKDSSGNSNNFTPNNFSVAAGAGNDSVSDTPTNNFCTFNPLKKNISTPVTYTEGNLQFNGVSGNNHLRSSVTIPVSSGKWYVEFKMVSGYSGTDPTVRIGIITASAGHRDSNNDGLYYENTNNATSVNYGAGGAVYVSNTSQITGLTTYTNNDVMGIALDLDNDKFFVSKNGTFFSNGTGTQDPAAGTNALYSGGVLTSRKSEGFEIAIQGYSDKVVTADFGQQGFAYTPPAGFKAICTANLPDPVIKLPNKHFGTILYTGNGSSQTISDSNAVNFKPDWIWFKKRSGAESHHLSDSIRGANKRLVTNSTAAETTDNNLTSFNNNGFTISGSSGGSTNDNGDTYAAWNWNGGDTDGKTYTVTVVSDSGNKYRFDGFGTSAVTLDLAEGGTYIFDQSDSSNAGHPLRFSTTSNGTHGGGSEYTTGVTTSGTPGSSGAYTQIVVAASAPTLYYYCTQHSGMGGQANTNSTLGSSNFDGSTQSTVKVNQSAGFSIVKYAGNGSTATIGHGLGAAPQTYIVKEINSTADWYVYHKEIGATRQLKLNTNDGRANNDRWQDTHPTSSVFYLAQKTASNGSGDTYIAYCFSEVVGYSKFGSYIGNGNADGAFIFTGFRPAWIMLKRSDTDNNWHIADNKRQKPFNDVTAQIYPNLNNAEVAQEDLDIISNGFKIRRSANFHNASGGKYIYLAFAESPFKNARAR